MANKVVVFSDLHAHPLKPYATVLPSGMNSRLFDAISALQQVLYLAKTVEADLLLFGGDMFHTRRTVNVQAFNAVLEKLSEFSVKSRIPVVMIPGNHDQVDRSGVDHSIYAFQMVANVVTDAGWFSVAGKSGTPYEIMCVPYTENVEVVRQITAVPPTASAHRLFLGHLGIQGAEVGADFVYPNPYDVCLDDLNLPAYSAAFLGHFHKHQRLAENCWYIGAALQHTWGDTNQPRGCLVYDTDTQAIEHVELQSPRFVSLAAEQLTVSIAESGRYTDDYLRVPVSDLDDREEWRKAFGARKIEETQTNISKEAGVRVDMKLGSTLSDLLPTYVHARRQDDLDDQYLLQLGNELLEEEK